MGGGQNWEVHSRFRVLFSVTNAGSGSDWKEVVNRWKSLGRFFSFSNHVSVMIQASEGLQPPMSNFRIS